MSEFVKSAAQAQPERISAEVTPLQSLRYAWFVVGVLTLAYVFSFIDRQIFSMVVTPLRRDLNISDFQVSLLIGFSFVLFYTAFGIPIGRLTDVYSRRVIIVIGLVLWCMFTTGCGLAKTFPVMLALRMGVGVGEAALSPAAYSLITDYVPRHRLSTAISIYSMGIYLGAGLSYVLGGVVLGYASTQTMSTLPLVGQIHPWQILFFVVGLPGLAVAPLLFTIREPARVGSAAKMAAVPMWRVFAYIFQNWRTFLLHNIGFGFLSLTSYTAGAWVPTFYVRTYHSNIRTVGIIYGIIVIVFGSAGIIGAGRLADYMRSRGRSNANVLLGALIGLVWIPIHLLLFLAPSATWATVWLVPGVVMAAAPFGIAPAAIQQMMPARMRGQASAVYLFILNMIGLGLGPTAVALFTEHIFKRDDALRYSLVIVTSAACVLSVVLLCLCLKPFLTSLERLRLHESAELHNGIGSSDTP
jgi:MFS family permease